MIGIISAMQEEMQTLLENLQESTTSVKGMRTYYKGTLFNRKVVLVFSRWGKVASTTTATQLINAYDIDEILFTGVAGSISKNLNIGDVVLGKHLFQHDMDARPLFDKFEVPLLGKTYFKTSVSHREKLYKATQNFINSYTEKIDSRKAKSFHILSPKVIISDIASGDQFISEDPIANKLNHDLPTVSCVEMEGAAVAQVCFEYDIPFSIIRIISDKANDNAHVDFPKFAKEIASHYALEILKNYFSINANS